MIEEKPLFIPLNAEHYNAFDDGTKTSERRLYGPRWNEKTCRIGRRVTLSYGYGKARRRTGTVSGFNMLPACFFCEEVQAQIMKIYGTLDKPIAEIVIAIDPKEPK